MKNKKVAVIGGNGYLGKHVTKYFDADPYSRSNGFDMTNEYDVRILSDYDVIIHMGALVDKNHLNYDSVLKTNILGVEKVARVLNSEQVLIFTSTKEVHRRDIKRSAYAFSKRLCEESIISFSEDLGYRAGIFRLSTTYAPSENGGNFVNRFVRNVRDNEIIVLKERGKQIRDLLYVEDLSRAFKSFIECDKIKVATFEIGGGPDNATSFVGLIGTIGDVLDKDIFVKLSGERVEKDEKEYVTDIHDISQYLNWIPLVGIREGIEKLV